MSFWKLGTMVWFGIWFKIAEKKISKRRQIKHRSEFTSHKAPSNKVHRNTFDIPTKHDNKQICNFVYKSSEKTTASITIQSKIEITGTNFIMGKMFNLPRLIPKHELTSSLLISIFLIECVYFDFLLSIYRIEGKILRSNGNIHSKIRNHWCSCEFYASRNEWFICKIRDYMAEEMEKKKTTVFYLLFEIFI